jgi:hypothetical protein
MLGHKFIELGPDSVVCERSFGSLLRKSVVQLACIGLNPGYDHYPARGTERYTRFANTVEALFASARYNLQIVSLQRRILYDRPGLGRYRVV